LQVLELKYNSLGDQENNSHCQFLQNQTKLRELKLVHDIVQDGARLFNDSLCSAAPFKLKKLIIETDINNLNLPHGYQEDLFNLIKQQHSSLRELEIDCMIILNTERQEVLLKMQLQYLYLCNCSFVTDNNHQIHVQNETIKSITLCGSNTGEIVLAEFLKRCLQVREIYLASADHSVPLNFVLSRLPKLEKLTLDELVSVPICIPSLKVLHLSGIDYHDENTRQNVISLVGGCRQLKELKASRRLLDFPEFVWVLAQLNLEKLELTD
jgi:hypothetical protein